MTDSLNVITNLASRPCARRAVAKQQTKNRLLHAARRLLAERSYDAVTLRGIAAAAEVTTGAVFSNFNCKAEIFNGIVECCYNELYESLNTVNTIGLSARDKVIVLMKVAYDRSEQLGIIQAKSRQSWRSGCGSEARIQISMERLLSIFRKILADGVESGEFSRSLDIDLGVEMIWDCCMCNFERIIINDLEIPMSHAHLAARIDFLLKSYLVRC